MLADVVHSIGLCFFRVGELVNPDRLRHVAPPASGSTVARSHTANTCPEGQMFSAGSNGSTSGLSLKQTKRELTTKTPLRRDNNPITGDMAVPVNGRTERLKPTIGLWI